VHAARERKLDLPTVAHFESVTAEGVRGEVGGRRVLVGKRAWLEREGIDAPEIAGAVLVAVDGRVAGGLEFADPIKATSPEAIDALHALGVRVVMLTGDQRATAERIARELKIDEVLAEVSPAQKQEKVEALKRDGRVVAMAGDGVNDAPALAAADVGIAMGTGTDVAMQSAGVTLVRGDLRGIVEAIALSRATMRNIRQNLAFAFLYNVLGVPIAAGVLYPFFGVLLSPMIASAAMAFSSVSVVGNALRLRNVTLTR
jgi:Cu+-exporting ATPase